MAVSMIERVAKAAHDSLLGDGVESTWPESAFSPPADYFRDAARAAILAMREPTDGLIVAGSAVPLAEYPKRRPITQTEAQFCYRAMIDQALTEP